MRVANGGNNGGDWREKWPCATGTFLGKYSPSIDIIGMVQHFSSGLSTGSVLFGAVRITTVVENLDVCL